MEKKKFLIYDILNEAAERIPRQNITFHDIDEALIKLGFESKPYYDDIEKEVIILYLSREDKREKLENAEIKNKFLQIKLEITDNQLQITRDIIQSKLDKILDVLSSQNNNE